jgi:hypothetical protein
MYTVLRVDLKDTNALVLACHTNQVLAVAGQYQLREVESLLFWRGELDSLAGWLLWFIFLGLLQPQLLLDRNIQMHRLVAHVLIVLHAALTIAWPVCCGHEDVAPLLDCTTIFGPLAPKRVHTLEPVEDPLRATRHW